MEKPHSPDDFSGSGDLEDSLGSGESVNETNDRHLEKATENLINSFIVMVCLLGLVGNGVVIWLLGFQIKRNSFTTYIMNLSIADLGVLISIMFTSTLVSLNHQNNIINTHSLFFLTFFEIFLFTSSASQFLLAAVSIDRCVAVLFPLWHRCHRPPHQSAMVCALMWILSFLLAGIHFSLLQTGSFGGSPLIYQFILNVFLGTPIMLISTLILSIHVCHQVKQHQQGKLVTAIFLALFFFLIFAIPLNVFYVIDSYYGPFPMLMATGFGCASLKSSINPMIYCLVGWSRMRDQPQIPLRAALQRVFKDEQDSEEQNTTKEIFLSGR